MDHVPANQGGPAAGTSTAPREPSAVDRASFGAEFVTQRIQEKAYTREGDALAASRRRLPTVDVELVVDANLTRTVPEDPIALLDAFGGGGHDR